MSAAKRLAVRHVPPHHERFGPGDQDSALLRLRHAFVARDRFG
ncbi:MAG: hypothetical protein VX815_17595 [Gemmatimonadota bacterium]|jgi:hypothetical protein|nr:hypothetical protein [Gemmatimonadota bacterium]